VESVEQIAVDAERARAVGDDQFPQTVGNVAHRRSLELLQAAANRARLDGILQIRKIYK